MQNLRRQDHLVVFSVLFQGSGFCVSYTTSSARIVIIH